MPENRTTTNIVILGTTGLPVFSSWDPVTVSLAFTVSGVLRANTGLVVSGFTAAAADAGATVSGIALQGGATGTASLAYYLSSSLQSQILHNDATDTIGGVAMAAADLKFQVGGTIRGFFDNSDSGRLILGGGLATTGTVLANAGLTVDGGNVVFNEASGDFDFRIESNDNANMFVVDAALNVIGIGTSVASNVVMYLNPTLTTPAGTVGRTLAVEGSITAAVGQNASILTVAGTIVEAASDTHTLLAGFSINAPVITAGAATVADTTTAYIQGAPTATVSGANYALLVDGGISRFDGLVRALFDTATTAGGVQALTLGASGPNVYVGSGAPTATAVQGSLYLRTDGGATTRAYINTDGGTTWTALVSVA